MGPYSDEILRSWRKGAEDFNQGHYWHAHEAWEQGWKNLPEPERTYIQALIQLAAVFHLLLEKKRVRPALALCALALDKFQRSAALSAVRPRLEVSEAIPVLKAILGGAHSRQALDGFRPRLKAVLL